MIDDVVTCGRGRKATEVQAPGGSSDYVGLLFRLMTPSRPHTSQEIIRNN